MSRNLSAGDIIAVKQADGWHPTPLMQGWWRNKTRTAPHPRALQPFAIATPDGKPSRYFMSLHQVVYGRNPLPASIAIIREGKATGEFLLVAND